MVRFVDHVGDEVLVGAVDGIHDVGIGSVLCYFGEGPICFTLSSPRNIVDLRGVKRLCFNVQKNLYYNIKIQM